MTETHDRHTGADLTLVTGGTGKTGSRVADRLRAQGRAVRIGSRRADPPFDWNDRGTWDAALRGVTAAYVAYVPDLGFPGAADDASAFARAAAEHGVRRLVLLSGRGEEEAQRSEEAVRSVAPHTTVVRASWFMQNFSEHFLLEPVLGGVVALPAGDVVEPFVDADDIADVAVAALTGAGHEGRTYELTGPQPLGFADAAAVLSRATGREIAYVPVSAEEYTTAALAAGVPAEEVEPLTELFASVLDGRNAAATGDVERLLGRPARDFATYARTTAATGVWDVEQREVAR